MRQSLLVLCVVLVAIFSAKQLSAQDIRIGIKTGIGYTGFSLSGDDANKDLETPFKFGFQGGGFAVFDFGTTALQLELFFSAQGGKDRFENEYFESTSSINLNYLQLPVLLRFGPAPGWYGFVGPQVGFFLGTGDDNYEDVLKSIDFAAVLGVGYEFPLGLGLDLRYNLGLVNVYDDKFLGEADLRLSNHAIQLTLSHVIFRTNKEDTSTP